MLPAEETLLSVGDADSALTAMTGIDTSLTAMTGIDTSLTSLLAGGATMMPSPESLSTSEVFGTEVRRARTAGVLRGLVVDGFTAASTHVSFRTARM